MKPIRFIAILVFLTGCTADKLSIADADPESPVYDDDDNEPTAYLCIPEYTIGYGFKEGKWQPVKINVKGEKYVLNKNGSSVWGWDKYEEEDNGSPHFGNCGSDGFNKSGYIKCAYNVSVEVRFNRETLRFIATQTIGYVVSKGYIEDGFEDNMVFPYMQIGTCKPLQNQL